MIQRNKSYERPQGVSFSEVYSESLSNAVFTVSMEFTKNDIETIICAMAREENPGSDIIQRVWDKVKGSTEIISESTLPTTECLDEYRAIRIGILGLAIYKKLMTL